MIIIRNLFSVLAVLFCLSATAQSSTWVSKMMSGEHSFLEIQEQFNSDWDGREYERGHGYKQFKRWEYFWKTRLMPDGSFPDYGTAIKSLDKYLNKYNGNFKSTNDGGAWTPMGPTSYTVTSSYAPGMGRVNFVMEDPNNPSIIYVATPGGGAWKSTDSGSSWTPLSDNLASIGVSSIGVAKTNSQVIYMATGDADGADTPSIGVVKSIDGGASWTIVASTTAVPGELADLLVDPTDEDVVYVASKTEGLYKTINGGTSWSLLIAGTYRDIEFKPGSNQVIYAAGASDIQKTTNAGASWTAASGVPANSSRIVLGVTPADDAYVYALIADADGNYDGLYRSTNSANSFVARNTTTECFEGDQSWYDMCIAVSPTNKNLLFTGVLNIWKSNDGGSSLSVINDWSEPTEATYTHADIHFLRYFGNSLFCGSDGGIYKSTNDGVSFADLSVGLQISQFYRISGVESDPNIINGGLQDNGNFYRAGTQWRAWLGADGMDGAVNPNNPMEAYGMNQNGGLHRTLDGGVTEENWEESSLVGEWVTPMIYDPSENRVVAGYADMQEFKNDTWTQLSTYSFPDLLSCLEMAPSNNQVFYMATMDYLFITSDNGASVTDLTDNFASLNMNFEPITSIEVDKVNPAKVWISLGGWTAGTKVLYSADSGATWTNVSGTLPNLPCNIVKQDASSSEANAIYVGMDVGVYYRDASHTDFIPFMTDLPRVKVMDIEINETNDLIRLGTYGRGIWESPTHQTTATPLVTNVQLKLFLEGNYTGNGMSNLLNENGLLPLNNPYTGAPWNSVLTVNPASLPANTVDYVLIQAYSGIPNATGSVKGLTLVESQLGLLQANGDINSVTGGTGVNFDDLNLGDDYYFIVRHRNHLDVLTATALTSAAVVTYDFTTAESAAFGIEQLKQMSDGKFALYAGDFNVDAVIQVTDYDSWKIDPSSLNTYKLTDANLDGVVQTTDYDIWFKNKAKLGTLEVTF
ncbi:hypothetical protein N8482_01725 [Chitinophagales bacterium]|nr:hypothetical protein [Chitinophagales bacterium]